jgi:hypothetical protein
MGYGDQKGNGEWKDLSTVNDKNIYSSRPDKKYYEDRLGKRD